MRKDEDTAKDHNTEPPREPLQPSAAAAGEHTHARGAGRAGNAAEGSGRLAHGRSGLNVLRDRISTATVDAVPLPLPRPPPVLP
jgi:hypothetical protein